MRLQLRFYAELNDYLPAARRGKSATHDAAPGAAIRDIVQELGVPVDQIDLILLNGAPAGFEERPADGDRIACYPVFETFDVAGLPLPRAAPLRETRFIADGHLGKLARLLRMVGFDTVYDPRMDAAALVSRSNAEKRIILSRCRKLFERRELRRACLITWEQPPEQLQQVLDRFQLRARLAPFSRCLTCNGPVAAQIAPPLALQPEILANFTEFFTCTQCGGIYWKGSHYQRMAETVAHIMQPPAAAHPKRGAPVR